MTTACFVINYSGILGGSDNVLAAYRSILANRELAHLKS